jgi:hypothetical protein
VASAALAVGVLAQTVPAVAAAQQLDLRVLVVDDGSVMVGAIANALDLEGVPHTTVALSSVTRPTIDAAFLANGLEGRYQAVVLPQSGGSSLTTAGQGLSSQELADLTAYESAFHVRQVDTDELPGPQVGLQSYSGQNSVTWGGPLDGLTATVTPAAKASGWGYLSGPVPFLAGTYALLSTPLTATSSPALPAGASFTPVVTVPIPGAATAGTLIGEYATASTEQLVITGAFAATQQQFRMLSHGVVTWMTRGLHFGYSRNYYSQQFDDAFSYDARWNSTYHCTPGEDCAPELNVPASDIRMSAADVDRLVAWQSANGYNPTLAFNAYYSLFDSSGNAWGGADSLTNEFVKYRSSLRWLDHGYEHVYQGCQQDFTHVPWTCVTTDGLPAAADGSNIVWTPTAAISSEISANVAQGKALGLPFTSSEYLSGEHSGLYLAPQQPVDNPSFAAALTQNAVTYIGADASREPAQRQVGAAYTVPRHPVALYYNVSTAAEEVNEYNWIYTSSGNGGSGYCEANPATATCLASPLSPTTGFASYIVPTDAANDLRFILSNDPRPFYAHVSNLTAPDYLGLTLMSSILSTYRSAYAATTPLVNQTLTQAGTTLRQQDAWRTSGMPDGSAITGSVSNGIVTITNPTSVAAPLTAPTGTFVNGVAFGSAYAGERSAWVSGSTSLSSGIPAFTSAASTAVRAGTPFSFTVSAAQALTLTSSTLPAGVTFVDRGNGTATLAGNASVGTSTLSFTAVNALGSATQAFTLVVGEAPAITSDPSATFTVGAAGTFGVTTTGYPAPTLALTGTLPRGVTFSAATGALSGTPLAGSARSYPVTVSAANALGRVTQALTLVVTQVPAFTSGASGTMREGVAATITVRTSGFPVPTVSLAGSLPAGVAFSAGANGTAVLSGTPGAGTSGSYPLTLTATSATGTAVLAFSLTVQAAPVFTSAPGSTAQLLVPLSITISASGSPTPRITATTPLPPGLRLRSNGNGSATLSGTPTLAGSWAVGLRAANAAGTTVATFTLEIV